MVFVLALVVLQSISFSNYALTTKTTNIIHGSAPYLTFDGGLTRVTNTEALLRISLSDGRTFTPKTANSSDNPIVLPVAGQSFADIGMLMPTDTDSDSIALSSLIGTPYNYWGDDDGDGQGVYYGVTATGNLSLSIVDKDDNPVARNEVLTICKAPYKLTLSNGEGRLTTRYGVPNESRFSAGNATYYINPNISSPAICYARPNLRGSGISAAIWNPDKGFLTQSVTPSSYGSNFPTTGANNLYFYLDIRGNNQALSWAPVSHEKITATMTDSTSTSVRVTLRGPVATSHSDNPGRIDRPSLPQTFELVGRDSSGNAVVKYGFVLKQWFVNRGYRYVYTYSSMESWCNKIGGYHLPKMKDLTNASCRSTIFVGVCDNYANKVNALTATPLSSRNSYMRYIGAGFFSEWGNMNDYTNTNFFAAGSYWTQDMQNRVGRRQYNFDVRAREGMVFSSKTDSPNYGVCVYP